MPTTRRGFLAATGAATAAGTTGVILGAPLSRSRRHAAPAAPRPTGSSCTPAGPRTHAGARPTAGWGCWQIWASSRSAVSSFPHQDECRRTARLCRRYGIKWLMTVTTRRAPQPARGQERVRQIADRLRGRRARHRGHQRARHEQGRLGEADGRDPARDLGGDQQQPCAQGGQGRLPRPCTTVNEDRSNGAGYRALKRQGIAELCDVVGLHSYPKGRRDHLRPRRPAPTWSTSPTRASPLDHRVRVDQLHRRLGPEPDDREARRDAGVPEGSRGSPTTGGCRRRSATS